MPTDLSWLLRRETLLAGAVALLAAAALLAWYLLQATVLTVAVAPREGTEPGLIRAYANALESGSTGLRLKILDFDDVRESAAALQDGRADLAVVRPDVLLPTNGLSLAILRDQAMLIASPDQAGIKDFPHLAGKRLGIGGHRDADIWLLKSILGYYGLTLEPGAGGGPGDRAVVLVPVAEDAVAGALRERRIDAFISIIAPSAPKALDLVAAVRSVARGGKVEFVAVEDDDAVIERFPKLQAVAIPGGLFGGRPKLPADDVKTVGASYRLMARASLSRAVAADMTQQLFEKRTEAANTTEAADYVQAPAYETTVAATSARIPIHPGALDYYEREQHGFVERYGDTLYLLGALAGGLVSVLAWIRQRLAGLRREHIDEIVERLLAITEQARAARDPAAIAGLTREVERLAGDAVRYARERAPDAATMSAVTIALDTARATIADLRHVAAADQPGTRATSAAKG
ncbi:TAXI family TRAP transporter solute-binding subunit [Methylobacterium sp. J-077]|uniref:TAXI family TRAP transporter solute-binding subunit n=1 Tax=Methylobacterium sp. J-077 TaxID=2836656 RepID=UPI001FBACEB9|nr:TAXI family TRAP transporter solute-binding subunit [Methylobacterium sp. J-077]MCJ2124453.1 C4-dicarboxylate ABC transporter substrate-binding protein [Methylobacterium sp. J-077]